MCFKDEAGFIINCSLLFFLEEAMYVKVTVCVIFYSFQSSWYFGVHSPIGRGLHPTPKVRPREGYKSFLLLQYFTFGAQMTI